MMKTSLLCFTFLVLQTRSTPIQGQGQNIASHHPLLSRQSPSDGVVYDVVQLANSSGFFPEIAQGTCDDSGEQDGTLQKSSNGGDQSCVDDRGLKRRFLPDIITSADDSASAHQSRDLGRVCSKVLVNHIINDLGTAADTAGFLVEVGKEVLVSYAFDAFIDHILVWTDASGPQQCVNNLVASNPKVNAGTFKFVAGAKTALYHLQFVFKDGKDVTAGAVAIWKRANLNLGFGG